MSLGLLVPCWAQKGVTASRGMQSCNTCSACDAPSTMEALPREERGDSVPPRHWLGSSGLGCAGRRLQCTPDLQQLKVGVAGSLHPSNGLQVDYLSQWHFTEPRRGWC